MKTSRILGQPFSHSMMRDLNRKLLTMHAVVPTPFRVSGGVFNGDKNISAQENELE